LLDAEFRYNFGLSMFQNGSLLANPTNVIASSSVPTTSLSNTTQNEATLTLATGSRFGVLGSKLTFDAAQVSSPSAATSTSAAESRQFRGFDDVQYQVNREFAAIGRIGYEDLRFPGQSVANTTGIIYSFGGRYTPFPGAYLLLNYGRQDGINGVNGDLRYQVTAATTISASIQHNRTTSQQQLLNNLNRAVLAPNGVLVDALTGVPIALTNPEFAFVADNVFRNDDVTLGIDTSIGRNTFSLIAFLDDRTALAPPPGVTGIAAMLAGSSTSWGANLNWNRTLRPNLTSSVSLGYAGLSVGHGTTITADAALNYIVSERLTATLHYQLINVSSNVVNGAFYRNQVEIGVRRSF
jgi:hypothetical protein